MFMRNILFVLPLLAVLVIGGCGYQVSDGDSHGHEGDDHAHYEGDGHDHGEDEHDDHEHEHVDYSDHYGRLSLTLVEGFSLTEADAGVASSHMIEDESGAQRINISFVRPWTIDDDQPDLTFDEWLFEQGYELTEGELEVGGFVFEKIQRVDEVQDEFTYYAVYKAVELDGVSVNYVVRVSVEEPITEHMQEILDSVEFFHAE